MIDALKYDELRSILEYEPLTGNFIWLEGDKFHERIKGKLAGSLYNNGYILIKIKGKRYPAHRLAFMYMTGKLPTKDVDHINHIRSDNRWVNLREVTKSENQRNKSKQSNNTSGITGVSWNQHFKLWCATIYLNNKKVTLGFFIEFSEAVNVRKNAEILYGFHENHGKDLKCQHMQD